MPFRFGGDAVHVYLTINNFDDPQVRELVRQTFKDLECAGSHVSDALKLMGWTADDVTVS